MTLENIFYTFAIGIMICFLALMIILIGLLYKLYRSYQKAEQAIQTKISSVEYDFINKKNLFTGFLPLVAPLIPFLFRFLRKRKR